MTKERRKFSKLKFFIFLTTSIVFFVLGGWVSIILGGNFLIDEAELAELQQEASDNGQYVRIGEMPDYVWKAFVP